MGISYPDVHFCLNMMQGRQYRICAKSANRSGLACGELEWRCCTRVAKVTEVLNKFKKHQRRCMHCDDEFG
jgi:hypothetical protein